MKIHGWGGVWVAEDRNAEMQAIHAGRRPEMVELRCVERRGDRWCWWWLGGVFSNPRLGAVLYIHVPSKPEPGDEPINKRIVTPWLKMFELQGMGGMALAGYCPRHGPLPLDETELGDAVDRWRDSDRSKPQRLTLKRSGMR